MRGNGWKWEGKWMDVRKNLRENAVDEKWMQVSNNVGFTNG